MTIYADLYRYRELFSNLFRRDLRAKYKGSALGVAWSLANPAMLMGVYLFVFSVLWGGGDIPHYALYLLAGLAFWLFFSTSLQTASRSMIDNAELIKKIRFPRQLVPLSLVATQLVTFAVMLAVLIVVDAIVIPEARATVWIAVPVALLAIGFTAGTALVIASLNVLFRDIEHLLAAALLPWFFLTPILWRTEQLPDSIARHRVVVDVLLWVNPVSPVVRTLRDPLWAGSAPAAGDLAYAAVAAVAALALGAWVFSRVDDRIAVEL
ncbi:MAG TPA: ABC transporter permease [Gaiellaceae bacterium]|nr:ABC transporter permease [Gaiellaceae bacterium]